MQGFPNIPSETICMTLTVLCKKKKLLMLDHVPFFSLSFFLTENQNMRTKNTKNNKITTFELYKMKKESIGCVDNC